MLLALIVWTIWGNTALMVNSITVSGDQIPSEFSGFRIAQVSDLHNAEFGEGNSHLLNSLSESKPDMIAITGDLVDAQHTNIDVTLSFAEKAVQIAPVYYVTGNHEASLSQYSELKTGLEAAGVIVLEDKAIQLEHNGGIVTLMGLPSPWSPGQCCHTRDRTGAGFLRWPPQAACLPGAQSTEAGFRTHS